MARRGITRFVAIVGALAVSCGGAQAGMLDSLLSGGIPIPGVGGIRVSSGSRRYVQQQQTPRMVSAHLYNEAIRLADNNQLQESRMKFEQAVQADPSFDLAWAALVGACMTSGQLEEGLQVGNQFLTNFPHSSKRRETELIVQKLNEQLAKKNEIWSRVGRDGADSYFALATEGKNFYGWNLDAMPLKVYIGDGHGIRGYRKNDDIILNNSFAEWTRATDGHITFTRVDNVADANIECIWIDDPKDFPQNRGMEAGEAVPMLDSDGYIVSSKLYLLTRERNDKASVDDLVMHTICLHEIGHTLGLLGHSDVAGDVMYFTANGQKVQEPHLTQRDVNTLAKLYSTILQKRYGVTQQPKISSSTVSQSQLDDQLEPLQSASAQSGSLPAAYSQSSSPQASQANTYSPQSDQASFARAEQTSYSPSQTGYLPASRTSYAPTTQAGYSSASQANNWGAGDPTTARQRQSTNPGLVSAPPPPEAGKYQRYKTRKTFPDNQQAVAYFERALANSPKDMILQDDLGTAYDNYGIELANSSDVRKAEECFKRALNLHRDSEDPSRVRISLANLTQLLRFEKRDSDAAQLEQSYKKVIARFGN
ncbi:MAG TPA: matrixin family metalloprotease [Drouetiella sp.]|jgi:tetratricopeptide (TPR) repeat protein